MLKRTITSVLALICIMGSFAGCGEIAAPSLPSPAQMQMEESKDESIRTATNPAEAQIRFSTPALASPSLAQTQPSSITSATTTERNTDKDDGRILSEIITSNSDPYSYVMKAWQTYVLNYPWDSEYEIRDKYTSEADKELVDGFIMRPEGFDIKQHYTNGPPTIDKLYYALIDMDSDGSNELLLGYGGAYNFVLFDIYTIKNGVAVQQQNLFGYNSMYYASLQRNGTVVVSGGRMGYYGDCIYRFENGELTLSVLLTSYETFDGETSFWGYPNEYSYFVEYNPQIDYDYNNENTATQISLDEYEHILDEYADVKVIIPWTPGWAYSKDYSSHEEAYYDVLLNDIDRIRESKDTLSALVDIFGDNKPELIYMTNDNDNSDHWSDNKLYIWTFKDHKPQLILFTSPGGYGALGDFDYYQFRALFTDGSGNLYFYKSSNNQNDTDAVLIRHEFSGCSSWDHGLYFDISKTYRRGFGYYRGGQEYIGDDFFDNNDAGHYIGFSSLASSYIVGHREWYNNGVSKIIESIDTMIFNLGINSDITTNEDRSIIHEPLFDGFLRKNGSSDVRMKVDEMFHFLSS